MIKSNSEDCLRYPIREPNPFCPVCAEGKTGGMQYEDTVIDGSSMEEHCCLLIICNTFYALSRFSDIQGKP